MGMEQGGYIDGDSGPEFTYGYGGGGDEFAIDYASQYGDVGAFDQYDFLGFDFGTGAEYGDSGYSPGGGNEPIDFAPYEPQWGLEPPTFEPAPISPFGGGSDLFGAYFDYYSTQGYDDYTAMQMAAQAAEEGSIQTTTEASYLPPDLSWPSSLPMTSYVDPWSWVSPYTPIFPDLPAPLPPTVTPVIPFTVPTPPQMPMPQTTSPGPVPIAPGLPPACPGGQYHPYPIGHPDQNKCIPFPPAQVSKSPAPVPAITAPGGGGASTSKPPAQQSKQQQQPKCPQGYYRDPATGQCRPIPQGQPQSCPTGYYRASNGQCLSISRCTSPGTVFDQARGLCVPKEQAISPLSEASEFGELFDNLKELPWWIWLALGGLILLSRDDDGKKTTVTYRRAR